jgi:hypothetical protein
MDANKAPDRIPPGPTAEKVFGRKDVHKHEGGFVGKKQDKAGHWRLTKVPFFSTNPVHAYAVQLGRLDRHQKEVSKIIHAKMNGLTRSTLSGGDQSCGTIRPGDCFQQGSQTGSKIESRPDPPVDLPPLFWVLFFLRDLK